MGRKNKLRDKLDGEFDMPGIYQDKHGVYWATLAGEDAQLWRERHPEKRSLPRRKAKTLREAVTEQQQLILEVKRGNNPQAANPRISDLVEQYISNSRCEPSTIRRYRQSLEWQIKPFRIGRLRLRQLSREHVSQWVRQLELHPRQDNPARTLDPYSIRNAVALLRAVLNNEMSEGHLSVNPASRPPKIAYPDDKMIMPLTTDEVREFLLLVDHFEHQEASETTRPHRNAALYHVAIRCGLRLGELCGLRWRDVDFACGELQITGQLQNKERKKTKTRKANRTVPLVPTLVEVLRFHQLNQQEEQAVNLPGWNSARYVFCSENGTPLDGSNVWRQFTALQRRTSLADPCNVCHATGKVDGTKCENCHGHKTIAQYRFHDLRHTYAALAIAAGVDIYTLQRRMGHESVTTTADMYGHLYKGRTDDADAIERLLNQGDQQ